MTGHFRLGDEELRTGADGRGVRSMNLREGDALVSMDVLPVELTDQVAANADDEETAVGPLGARGVSLSLDKQVPVTHRLQKRAGMGLRAMKFRTDSDELVGLVCSVPVKVVLVSEKRAIVRTSADAIPQQSRLLRKCASAEARQGRPASEGGAGAAGSGRRLADDVERQRLDDTEAANCETTHS